MIEEDGNWEATWVLIRKQKDGTDILSMCCHLSTAKKSGKQWTKRTGLKSYIAKLHTIFSEVKP